jgi:hypothetical protein
MYRAEAPNVVWAVKLEVCDATIMELVPEVVYRFHLLELGLFDPKTEAGVDMLLGESFDRQQPGRTHDETVSATLL